MMRAVVALATAVPIALVLFVALAWSSAVPEPEDWRRLAGREPLCFEWNDVTAADETPKLYVFRALYAGLLALPGSDFGRLAIVGWLLAVGTWWMSRRLTIPADGAGRAFTAAFGLVAAFVAFSPSFGADWLLGARLQVFVPPLAAVVGAALLLGTGRHRLRIIGALLLAALAVFTDPRGPLVWIALAPLVWASTRAAGGRAGVALAVWIVAGNVLTVIAHDDFTTTAATKPGLGAHVVTAPVAVADYALRHVCDGLPLTALASTPTLRGVGAGLLALWLVLGVVIACRSAHPDRLRATAWWSLAAFGALSPLLAIGDAFPPRAPAEWVREFTWGAWLLPIGVLAGFRAIAPRIASIPVAAGLAAMGIAALVDFAPSTVHLGRQRSWLGHGTAMHVFYDALGEGRMSPHLRPPVPGSPRAAHLRGLGLLGGAAPASTSLRDLRVVTDGPAPGRLTAVRTIGAVGEVAAGRFRRGPDAVLLTLRRGTDETIIQLTHPDYLEPDATLPWLAPFVATAFVVDDEVRAYAFDAAARTARPLDGVWRFDGRAFADVTGGAR